MSPCDVSHPSRDDCVRGALGKSAEQVGALVQVDDLVIHVDAVLNRLLRQLAGAADLDEQQIKVIHRPWQPVASHVTTVHVDGADV